jgi:two-component system, chemotaxis family, response regulator WspR
MSNQGPPAILLVEDDPDTAALIREALADHFGADRVSHCNTVAQALAADVNAFDLVLTDMNMPDGTGLDVLASLLAQRADLPVVIVTGESVLKQAVQAIRDGAYDYVVKSPGYMFTVPLIVEKNLATWRTKQEKRQLQDQLERTLEQVRVKNHQLEQMVQKLEAMATTDPLTGLANRRAFGQALERCFAEANRYGRDLACVMIDLDDFKRLNDTLGHQAGDDLLRRLARVLEANCRRSDVAARFGGDEFVLLMPQTDRFTAKEVAHRIRKEFTMLVESLYADAPTPVRISLSMGVACLRHSLPAGAEQLVAQADRAMYLAKQAGKDALTVFSAETERTPVPAA